MNKVKERLVNEQEELSDKLDNLKKFIESDKFKEIDGVQQTLLNIQARSMETYNQCLLERIVRFNANTISQSKFKYWTDFFPEQIREILGCLVTIEYSNKPNMKFKALMSIYNGLTDYIDNMISVGDSYVLENNINAKEEAELKKRFENSRHYYLFENMINAFCTTADFESSIFSLQEVLRKVSNMGDALL